MLKKIKWFIIASVFFTSSMDLFLSFNVYGFNIRIALILMIVFILIQAREIFFYKDLKISTIFFWLFLFAILNTIFAFFSYFKLRSLGYAVWLWIYVLWVFFLFQFGRKEKNFLSTILYLYLFSFIPAMIFGWMQWIFPSLSIIEKFPFKTQGEVEIIKNVFIHRINGWNYEPSYFATYIIVIFPILLFMFKNSKIIEKTFVFMFFLFSSLIIILSTSRMGWIAFILNIILFLLIESFNFMKAKSFYNNLIKNKVLNSFMLLAFLVCLYIVISFTKPFLEKLLKYSFTDRLLDMQNTLLVFFSNPFVGKSLGGVAIEIARNELGNANLSSSIVKSFEGCSIFFEYLAAMGIWGIFILGGLVGSILKILKTKNFDSLQKRFFIAITIGLMLQIFLLMFNQNMLRTYFWNHIAIFICFLLCGMDKEETFKPLFSKTFSKVVTSFFSSLVISLVFVLIILFLPLNVKLKGFYINLEGSLGAKPNIVYCYFDLLEWRNYQPFIIKNDKILVNFSEFGNISKTYFSIEEVQSFYYIVTNLITKGSNIPGYLFPFLEVDKKLREINSNYYTSVEAMSESFNKLLQRDDLFLEWSKKYSFSDLTKKYLKKNVKSKEDVIRTHRLMLEDMINFLPRNLDEHIINYFWLRLVFNNKELVDVEKIRISKAILNTDLGQINYPEITNTIPVIRKLNDKVELDFRFSISIREKEAFIYKLSIIAFFVFCLSFGVSFFILNKIPDNA